MLYMSSLGVIILAPFRSPDDFQDLRLPPPRDHDAAI